MGKLRPQKVKIYAANPIFVHKLLSTAKQVFVRHDGTKRLLQQTYDGPFPVPASNENTFTIQMNGREVIISIECLKPTYMVNEHLAEDEHSTPATTGKSPDATTTIRSGRRVRFQDRLAFR